jgi:SWI/SNF-related matrix-associated actin-dependent regulator 1 of chromatin subfamily A
MYGNRRLRSESDMDSRREDGLHPIHVNCLCPSEFDHTGCPEHDPLYHDRRRRVITFKGGIWVANLPFAANSELKAAGWRFHGSPAECRRKGCRACRAQVFKRWWTDSAVLVRKLPAALLETAAARALEEHDDTVEASAAEDAELEVPAPPGLSYLPFQVAGIAYVKAAPRPRRVLLGDEMGLGKCVESIGYMNLEEIATALVVCPASLRINWKRELERWLVQPRTIHIVDSDDPPPPDAEVVIVNYERLIRPVIHGALMSWWWELLICDEAHYLKSPTAKRTVSVLGRPARRADKTKGRKAQEALEGLIHRSSTFLPLTGTALLNRPIELWTLVNTLDPEGFPDKHQFGIRYCGGRQIRVGWDKEKGEPKMAWEFKGASNLAELQDKLRGRCLVRRMKADVMPELPPKRHEIIVLDPKAARTALKDQMSLWWKRDAKMHSDMALVLDEKRQDRARYEAAVARLEAELEVAFDEMSSERKRVAVAKIPLVIEHVKNLVYNHDVPKLVVWAHHHEVIDALIEAVPESVWIDGRVTPKARQQAVDTFQTNPECRVLFGGIRAAGEGITLTAASHEVFAELDWTPARNQQAEDRLHRIGQEAEMVLIQHLVFDGSLDALIAKVVVGKARIADKVLNRENPR